MLYLFSACVGYYRVTLKNVSVSLSDFHLIQLNLYLLLTEDILANIDNSHVQF